MSSRRRWIAIGLIVAGLALGGPAAASADPAQQATPQMEELSKQPARVLAQQAIGVLDILGNVQEADMRVDAALDSRDTKQVDMAALRQASEALDAGDKERALKMLDAALSRPLGAESGKQYHGSGRQFTPATGAQEIVGIVAGAVLLLLGAAALARRRGAGVSP